MTEVTRASVDVDPSALLIQDYSATVADTVQYDPGGATVCGHDPATYFLSGLYEEFAETLEFDAPFPEYSRIGVLALSTSEAQTYLQHEHDLHLHRREFGDVLWCSTALLNSLDLSLERSMGRVFPAANTMQGFDQAVADNSAYDGQAGLLLSHYRATFGSFVRSAAQRLGRPEAPANVTEVLAGRFLRCLSWVAQDRLDSSLAEVADGNIQKIRSRQEQRVIFGNSNAR